MSSIILLLILINKTFIGNGCVQKIYKINNSLYTKCTEPNNSGFIKNNDVFGKE